MIRFIDIFTAPLRSVSHKVLYIILYVIITFALGLVAVNYDCNPWLMSLAFANLALCLHLVTQLPDTDD